jgi:hypothetical protein
MTNRKKLSPEVEHALDMLKMEVAQEVGVQLDPTGYNGNLTAKEAGQIGGNMVKKLIQLAEGQLNHK